MTITLDMHLYSQDSDNSAGWEDQPISQVQTAEPQACANGVCSPACTGLGSGVQDPGAKVNSVLRIFICRPCLCCPAMGVHLQQPCAALCSPADEDHPTMARAQSSCGNEQSQLAPDPTEQSPENLPHQLNRKKEAPKAPPPLPWGLKPKGSQLQLDSLGALRM